MTRLVIKELQELMSHWLIVVTIGAFVVISGLFLWVFPDTSYMVYGYASPELFFDVAYSVMLFVIPALAVGFFSSEYRHGTIEVLATLPQSWTRIVVAKFLAGVFAVLMLILFSSSVMYVITDIARDASADSLAQIIGSYTGMLLIGAAYVAVAVCMSTFFENSSIAFITAVIIGFVLYSGFTFFGQLFGSSVQYSLERLSLSYHADYLSRGVLSLSSITYLLSVIVTFLLIARWRLSTKQI